jgi:HEAT repeat protein/Uri superfamily endonuclease
VSPKPIGSYVLALWLDAPQIISVGQMGAFEFPAGWYLYVGSAGGPGGLSARLTRHCRRLGLRKQAQWHVDFLRERAVWGGAWGRVFDERLECAWAAVCRRLPGAVIIAPGFGASDCRCPAHLVYVPVLPEDRWFADSMDARRLYVTSEELDDLLRMLATGSEENREVAALALGRLGAAAIAPLAAMLAESDANSRWWAARALAEVGERGAVEPLVGALTDAEPDVRACAALALGRIGEGAAAPALASRLTDESAFVASIAADALSMIGESAIDALVTMLTDDSPHVRLLSVRALGRIKSQRAIVPLFGVLEDSSYLVRYYAQQALEALGVGMVFFAP